MKAIEIGMLLIIILVIFGAVLNSVENSTEKVIKAQEINNMEKLITEMVDNLINNPGNPDDWNKRSYGTPSLAIINDDGQIVPNSVSYEKLIALGNDYDKLLSEKYFNSKIKTSMELIPQKSTISSVKIGCEGEGDEIFSVTRLVKCDFYKSYVLKDFQNEGKCNKGHDQSENSCNSFKVFPSNLIKSDYYLLIDESENYDLKYLVASTRVVKERYWQTATSTEIYLNDEINFYDDSSAIEFVHLNKAHPKAVLVSVPKDFDEDNLNYNYFRTNECQFIVKAWY